MKLNVCLLKQFFIKINFNAISMYAIKISNDIPNYEILCCGKMTEQYQIYLNLIDLK